MESDPEIRNFLLSRALDPLFRTHEVTLLLPNHSHNRIKFNVDNLNLPVTIRRVTIPKKRLSLWRRSFNFSQMRFRVV